MDFEYFKFKDLNLFSRKDASACNERRYRNVFDVSELSSLIIELSLFNKKFDEEDWEAEFEFIIRKGDDVNSNQVIDNPSFTLEASAYENIVKITCNADQLETDSMEPGSYFAEVWYNSSYVAITRFHLIETGVVTEKEYPCFDIYSIRLFEDGEKPNPKRYDRTYFRQFQRMATRLIWTELEIRNKIPEKPWKGEFVFNYYNDLRQLIHREVVVADIKTIQPNHSFFIETGHGHPENVSWEEGKYTIELVFMSRIVAIIPFSVSDKTEIGKPDFSICIGAGTSESMAIEPQALTEADIFRDIDHLVGLEGIKKRLHDYAGYVRYLKLRDEMGIEPMKAINLHAVFSGNPGTGKTTIARMLGKIYKHLGLLPKDTVYEASRANLVGRFIGETAPITREVIEKARGGILLIDEAYSLAVKSDDNKDYGREVIETLLTEMSEGPGDIAVIVCGYPKEMEAFLDFNPGLRSRFKYMYDFPDYTPAELMEIAERTAVQKQLNFSGEVRQQMYKYLEDQYRRRTRSFGNARIVKSMLEEAQLNLGIRVINSARNSLTREDLCTILPVDMEGMLHKGKRLVVEMQPDTKLLNQALGELMDMIGLESVKTEISELTKLASYYRETGKDLVSAFSLNNIFTGNPGTGKTTVARIMAVIYKALGLLERGHLVECSREDLVGTVVGETAPKTLAKIESAIGGVLFIDEAYSLVNSNGHDFGHEAIEVLIKQMEDRRGEFSLIVAGYPREMNYFLDSNPGLRSRFDNHLTFSDFDADALMRIAEIQLLKAGMTTDAEASAHLMAYFKYHSAARNQYFGNGRFVRKVIERAIRNQNLRLSQIPKDQRSDQMIKSITLSDVVEFRTDSDTLIKRQIGFSG